MSRIKKAFDHPAYVAYLTAGDGGADYTLQSMLALVEAGVDIIEVGVPFSDPVADGPTIQAAATRALKEGMTLDKVLDLVSRFRKQSDVPIILFGYYNPIYAANMKTFFPRAKAAGVDACLVVDVPLEESQEYHDACIAADIDPVFIIAPNTPVERIKKINEYGKGLLYYACRAGTTGVKDSLPDDFIEKMKTIKSVATLPVVAGFGISNVSMAKKVIEYADGFVVGSYLVKAMADRVSADQLCEIAKSLDPR